MLGFSSARSLVLASFIALGAAPSLGCSHHGPHHSGGHGGPAAHSITVVGRGEISARPDIARVTLGVDTRAATVAEASRLTNERIAMVVAAVRATGIAEADVRTSNYSIYFERTAPPDTYGYGYPTPYGAPMRTMEAPAADAVATAVVPSAPPAPRAARGTKAPAGAASAGAAPPPAPSASAAPPPPALAAQGVYRVSNTVEITIRDVTKVAAVLDAAVGTGANEMQGVSFDIDAREPYDVKVREKAVADARTRAQALASLHGKKLGKVLAVSEVVSEVGRPMFSAMRDASTGGAQIAPGEITIQGQLQVIYAFEDEGDDD